MHYLAENVTRQPFEGFLSSCRTAYHITHGGDDFLHSHLAIVGFQLRQFLKAQGDTHLVASGCSYQSVYLMEIQGRQLINDDANWHILALSCIHSRYKAVENQGIQCTNDALHLGVIGNEQITRILRVTDLQVEVIAILVEYPITLLGGKTGGIDTQCANHSFQLLHGFVGKGGLERTQQGGYLIVGLEHLKDGLITLVEER